MCIWMRARALDERAAGGGVGALTDGTSPKRRLIAVLAGVFALLSCASPHAGQDGPLIAVVGASVIDPAVDGPPQQMDVLIKGEKIVAVGSNLRVPRGARRIDAAVKYLVPGLWDAHAHFNALTDVAEAPERYAGYGVLSVRDMGGDLDRLRALRASIQSGARVGPNMFIAGPTLNGQQSAPFHRVVKGPEEAHAAARELAAAGVDYIKTHRRTSREALFGMIDEARRHGLEVYGHVPLGVSWLEAANAGMRSMEHVFTILENEMSDPNDPARSIEDAIVRIDGARGDAIFAAMARGKAYLCPTLVAFERSIDDPPEMAASKRGGFTHFLAYVSRAHRAGVSILAGSDVAVDPGASLIRELELLVKAGLSPREALRAATTVPAGLLRRPDLASFTTGAQASFLILAADPTKDIAKLRDIEAVVLRGRILEREELARLRAMPAPTEGSP